MNTAALLNAQDWPRITAQLAAIAKKRSRSVSWATAEDIAQSAIVRAYAHGTGWDPAKGTLIAYLVAQVIGLTLNEARRRRNVCERELDAEVEETIEGDDEPIDEQLDRRRQAVRVHDELFTRLATDEVATMILTLMKEGIASPADLARATGRTAKEIDAARHRIRYLAARLTEELSAPADRGAPAAGAGAAEEGD
ncbi:MAG TPA: sigma factor [Polyangiaceae bacterium]|jgi:DNA-directed RNA polymerase specialized sigma24 family protein